MEGESARKFITNCENAMSNASTHDPGDKIAFVRSKLKLDSLAHSMMDSSVFTKPIAEKDYQAFRDNFLEMFDAYGAGHAVQGMYAVCDRLIKSVASKGLLPAQIVASQTVADLHLIQKENGWIKNGVLTEEDYKNFLDIFFYMLILKERERQAALSIEFKYGDDLKTFVNDLKLKAKPYDTGNSARYAAAAASAVAATQPALPGQDSQVESYAAAVSQGTVVLTCHYCSKPGHTANKCYAKQKDKKKARRAPQTGVPPQGAHVAVRAQKPFVSERPVRASVQPRNSAAATGKYCRIHNSYTHSLEECNSVEVLRQRVQTQARGTGGVGGTPAPSGEAPRPAQNRPG